MHPSARADGTAGAAAAFADPLVFRVDDLQCGMDRAAVVEILPALAVRPLPGQPPFVAGAIDLRGTLVPVLDLRVRFGRPPRPMELSDKLIVARAHGRALAVWVDAVDGLAGADAGGWTPSGGLLVGDRSVVGVVRTREGACAIHDLDAFVSACESDALAAALEPS